MKKKLSQSIKPDVAMRKEHTCTSQMLKSQLSTITISLTVRVRKLNMFNEREIEENQIPVDSNLSSIIGINFV